MFRVKYSFRTFSFVVLSAFMGGVLSFWLYTNNQYLNFWADMAGFTASVPTAVTTEMPLPQSTTESEISSDGEKKVVLETAYNRDNSKSVRLSTSDESGENSRIIFSKTVSLESMIVLPYNTWSPDNRYFFIEEHTYGDMNVLVFNAQGEAFANDEAYLDVTEIFAGQETGHTFREATGWGSYSVLIVNTTTSENEQGPSYWFEVPSKAVIRLSTLFL
jgi:hypothetical protein